MIRADPCDTLRLQLSEIILSFPDARLAVLDGVLRTVVEAVVGKNKLFFLFEKDDGSILVLLPAPVFVENPIEVNINGIYFEQCCVVCGRVCGAKDKTHPVGVFEVVGPGVFYAICYKLGCVCRDGLCFNAMFIKIFRCRVDIKGKIVIKHEPIIIRRERVWVKVEINVDKDRLYAVFRGAIWEVVNLLACRVECGGKQYDYCKDELFHKSEDSKCKSRKFSNDTETMTVDVFIGEIRKSLDRRFLIAY